MLGDHTWRHHNQFKDMFKNKLRYAIKTGSRWNSTFFKFCGM